MAKYINKDAVVAEIERLISNGQTKLKESEECKDYESYVALAERIATCINVLSILDTLEVKEVDLEKELRDFVVGDIDDYDMGLAKHFFELGMRASNPTTAADRGIADEIIFALNTLCEEKMISYDKEIEWVMNKVKEGE